MSKVRVAIAGLGNCANSLLQGVTYYADAEPDTEVPGLMNVDLGGYHVGDVEFVAGFDVDAAKVGQDLAKAIWSGPNNTIRFSETPDTGVLVQRGPTLDGLGKYYRDTVEESAEEAVDVVATLRESGAEPIARRLPRADHDLAFQVFSSGGRGSSTGNPTSRSASSVSRSSVASSSRRIDSSCSSSASRGSPRWRYISIRRRLVSRPNPYSQAPGLSMRR